MPLWLQPPRKDKTPNFSIRGQYLGVRVEQSARTPKQSVARKVLKQIEAAIERGEYPAPTIPNTAREPTFLSAANKYMDAGRRRRFIGRLIEHFGETPLREINQDAIDSAAVVLHPHGSPATRNAAVYTPVSAILRHSNMGFKLKRPKGAKGRVVTDYLNPEDAFAIIREAGTFDRELALLLRVLLYTGCRLGEALALTPEHVRPGERIAFIGRTKNGDPRTVLLRQDLADELAAHESRRPGKVFRFHQGGHLKHQLMRAKLKSLGLLCPVRRPPGWRQPPNRLAFVNYHTFRHTFATWMRRYGGADVQGLVATGNWRDAKSAARYAHVVPRDEWQRVEHLPSDGRGNDVESDAATG